jgi:hypothetical protein
MNKEQRDNDWSQICDEIFKSLAEAEKTLAAMKKALTTNADQKTIFDVAKTFNAISRDIEFLMDDAELWVKLNEIEDFIYKPRLEVIK